MTLTLDDISVRIQGFLQPRAFSVFDGYNIMGAVYFAILRVGGPIDGLAVVYTAVHFPLFMISDYLSILQHGPYNNDYGKKQMRHDI